MLDFHGLFLSYVALFPGGVYTEIKSLRLDLHLKRKQKKPQGQHQRFHRRRKKKKKTQRRRCSKKTEKKKKKTQMRDLGSPRSELGRGATWACVAGLDLARPGS